MENLIVLAVIVLILGAAAGYIWKEKKKGAVCVGCPYSGTCGKTCSGCSSAREFQKKV